MKTYLKTIIILLFFICPSYSQENNQLRGELHLDQIQEFLPEVLGQALARTWIDKRFLEAFYQFPVEILERGGIYLPDNITLEFKKEKKSRPKVIVFEHSNKTKRKILELKLIMVAEE